MIILFIAFILLGITCLVFAGIGVYKKRPRKVLVDLLVYGIIFLLMGAIPMMFYYQGDERHSMNALAILLGLLFLYIWLCGTMWNNIRCKTVVNGVYLKRNAYSGGRGIRLYAPVFSYEYEGKHYEQQTPQSFSAKEVDKRFHIMWSYQILIDPKTPEVFIIEKKVEILMLIIALLFLGGGLLL